MAVTTMELLTEAEALARREAILAHLGIPESDLRRRAARYELDARELAALDELDELDFVLGRVPA